MLFVNGVRVAAAKLLLSETLLACESTCVYVCVCVRACVRACVRV